ncbi:MAG TPA: TMEM175 family protein [Gemmatimonadaceae bacterium]|nr:TMEM175 family protein [Gemmatimonadaceae bacterium]
MHKGRLEAFSDGVVAILITIMVLELRPPHGVDLAALRGVVPTFLSYVLSFVFLGIYWNNHHHLFQAAHRVTGRVLWANLHMLFWLSLVPFVTSWRGENHSAPLPTALYGVVMLLSGAAFRILQGTVITAEGSGSTLARAIGGDAKGKISLACYVAAIALAFVNPWLSDVLFVAVALMWLAPDPRIERALSG